MNRVYATKPFSHRVSLELLQIALKYNQKISAAVGSGPLVDGDMQFSNILADFQEATELQISGTTARKEIQAVTHAAALPPAMRISPGPTPSLDELLKGTRLDDDA